MPFSHRMLLIRNVPWWVIKKKENWVCLAGGCCYFPLLKSKLRVVVFKHCKSSQQRLLRVTVLAWDKEVHKWWRDWNWPHIQPWASLRLTVNKPIWSQLCQQKASLYLPARRFYLFRVASVHLFLNHKGLNLFQQLHSSSFLATRVIASLSPIAVCKDTTTGI